MRISVIYRQVVINFKIRWEYIVGDIIIRESHKEKLLWIDIDNNLNLVNNSIYIDPTKNIDYLTNEQIREYQSLIVTRGLKWGKNF